MLILTIDIRPQTYQHSTASSSHFLYHILDIVLGCLSAYFTELITIIFLQIWLQFGASGKAFQGVTPSFHLSVK